MTALWISLAVAAAFLIIWRLRRAAGVLDRILREERNRTESGESGDTAGLSELDESTAEHRNR